MSSVHHLGCQGVRGDVDGVEHGLPLCLRVIGIVDGDGCLGVCVVVGLDLLDELAGVVEAGLLQVDGLGDVAVEEA